MNAPALLGSLLGTAVGDALGLPYEGLSRRRGRRVWGEPNRHRFLLGRGMVSDDTDHGVMTLQALAESGGDPPLFARRLARRLRWWLVRLPAGVGLATARAIVKLWLGFPPARGGVFSAGNGPAMRSAVLGAAVADPARLRALVRASTRLTHTDPKAEAGALAVAWAARLAASPDGLHADALLADLERELADVPDSDELLGFLRRAAASAAAGEDTEAFADGLGLATGVSGYIFHTVPVALHAALRHPDDYAAAVRAVVRCGGDTDTTAAVVGGIVGARVGVEGIPAAWRARLWDWPRSPAWVAKLAEASAGGGVVRPPESNALLLLVRNLLFLVVVLAHGLRRLLPPY